MQKLLKILSLVIVLLTTIQCIAQPNTNVDLDNDKPKQYENRKLGSEKTGDKKFNILRRITQNTYTHFNYYFNAKEKLKEVIENAKSTYKDDYTQLLSFYNYTLDGTSKSAGDLDSIIYKCTAGILLHDLRNDWVDNLYIVLGKAYLFRKDYDSAAGCFQYINFTYAPKDEGYDVPLGSNASNTNGVFTIATKEKRNLFKQITSKPPSRNESFIWQIRNYLEQDMLGEAAGLIGILRNDPNFPKRLQTDLHEMVAYWFYKQQIYDSAAWHLQKSFTNANDKAEKARWEYLVGQLYKLSQHDSLATKMFNQAIKHTADPLMEVYARLNIVAVESGKKKNALQDNLDELLKLAKKDKYENYRDIIYYAAAMLELQRNATDAAQNNLLKSVKYSVDNEQQKAKSFLLLADINYNKKNYIAALNFYDSTKTEDIKTLPENEKDKIANRKTALVTIVKNIKIIQREDSLQKIALMPELERNAYVKKILKQLRKAQGLKATEDEGSYNTQNANNANTNLFGEDKGEWYFINTNLKSKGYSEFKAKWGKRANVDNWRRQTASEKINSTNNKRLTTTNPSDVDDAVVPIDKKTTTTTEKKDEDDEEKATDLSFEGLMSKLPLTAERVDASNTKVEKALYQNGEVFQNKLEEYPSAIEAYNELIKRFAASKFKEDALFNLYYCYTKAAQKEKADSIKLLLNNQYPKAKSTQKINDGNNTDDKKANNTVTKKYEDIYNLFIEGKFDEATKQKKILDSVHGKTYWTPQLLFIEAIHYIKQKEDATAIAKLNDIITLFPKSALVAKATSMIDVVRRRKEIEDYLTNLKVETKEDEILKPVDLDSVTTTVTKTAEIKTTNSLSTLKKDSITAVVKPIITNNASKFLFVTTDAHYAMVVLNNVDRMFAKEAINSFDQYNKQKFYNEKIAVSNIVLNSQNTLLLIGPFANAAKAIDYIDKTKPVTATKIINWIPQEKYKYNIISNANLQLLKTNQNLVEYYATINQVFPDKF